MANIDWRIEAIDFTTCNCDFSCPCQFNARPTHDHCRAAIGFKIEKGYFGDTSLDGVIFVALYAWPGAVHEGRGEAQLIVDENTTEAQRRAVTTLFKGEETESGATMLYVYSTTVDTYYDMAVLPITFEADIAARSGRISVPGIVEANGQPIKNPVTGAPHRIFVTLPHGFEYHAAEYASSTVKTQDAAIPLEWTDAHAHLARVVWTPQGILHE